MAASRRLDSQLKRERVAAAVDALAAIGRELSIAAIARHAGVSRKFIYAHPELRAQIEQRARQATAATTARAAAGGHVTVASLRADLANAKAHNHRLRQQLGALEQRLSETLAARRRRRTRAGQRSRRGAAPRTTGRARRDLRAERVAG